MAQKTAFGKRLTRRLILASALFAGSPIVLFVATAFAAESPHMQRDDWYDLHVFSIVAPFAAIGVVVAFSILSVVLFSSSPSFQRSRMWPVRIAPFLIATVIGRGAVADGNEPPFFKGLVFLMYGSIAFFVSGAVAAVLLKNRESCSETGSPSARDGSSPSTERSSG